MQTRALSGWKDLYFWETSVRLGAGVGINSRLHLATWTLAFIVKKQHSDRLTTEFLLHKDKK
jgi:hypothetical protein